MSMVIVPNEWTEKNPFVSYSLRIWYDSTKYADEEYNYDSCSNAVSSLKNRIKYDDEKKIQLANIREDIIYRRTENTELSVSSPLFSYDYRKGFYI